MTALAPAIILPMLAAWLACRRYAPELGLLLAVPLAFALGSGAASLLLWFLLLTPLRSRAALLTVDMAVWLLFTVALLARRSVRPPSGPPDPRERGAYGPAITSLAAVTMAIAAVSSAALVAVFAHGEWDAWSIWNLRARFVYVGFPDHWRDMFLAPLGGSHPDYPLLVPLTVARAWFYLGRESPVVPIGFSLLSAGCIALTAGAAVRLTHSRVRGWLAAAAVCASPTFARYSAAQCADVPLALLILIALAMLSYAVEHPGRPVYWLLAGAVAGLAGWTKNEGLLFLALFALIAFATLAKRGEFKVMGWMAMAMAPVLVAVFLVKSLAPPNDLTSSQTMASLAGTVSDASRIQTVLARMASELWFGGARFVGPLPLVIAFGWMLRPTRVPAARVAAVTVILLGMLTGYAVAYVTTPHDLAWHLNTSVDRVVLQVFPALVWCAISASRKSLHPACGVSFPS